MTDTNHRHGRPDMAARDSVRPKGGDAKPAAAAIGSIESLRQAVSDLETVARSLKAAQRRSRFHVVE